MDFLKKHYEKLVLAIALVALIASAIYLALNVSSLSSQIEESPNPIPKVASAPHIALNMYTNAIQSLAQPPLWTNVVVEPFKPIHIGPTIEASTSTNPPEFPVILLNVVRKPFKLLFKIYSYDGNTKEGYNFQINFQFRARTFFTSHVNDPIKDRYEDTGYRIVKFEKKSTVVADPSLGTNREKDISELTVQHEGGKPVVLVLGLESEDEEPVAQARCGAAGAIREYRRGQLFECERKTYKVIDIDLKQMIIVDQQTQEQHTIPVKQ